MKQTKRFAVVGSDARQAAAGRALARAGYIVGGVQQLPQADCILLPLPLEQSGLPLAQLLGAAKPGALALGGKVTDSARAIARAAGVELVDYFARPELTVYNAIPTAEGCIGILLERRSRTLWGAAVLVLGFGPVGRALAVRLAALGARVAGELRIPLIGIGAGNSVDGQVLVIHDMLGITTEFSPRFLRRYADLHTQMMAGIQNYVADVKSGAFPNEQEQY